MFISYEAKLWKPLGNAMGYYHFYFNQIKFIYSFEFIIHLNVAYRKAGCTTGIMKKCVVIFLRREPPCGELMPLHLPSH